MADLKKFTEGVVKYLSGRGDMSLPLTVTLSFSLLIKSSILVAIEATEGAAFISGGVCKHY